MPRKASITRTVPSSSRRKSPPALEGYGNAGRGWMKGCSHVIDLDRVAALFGPAPNGLEDTTTR